MMEAGYPDRYRRDTLERCLRIYDRMVEDDKAGIRPLYRRSINYTDPTIMM
jgi:hypothetical protein